MIEFFYKRADILMCVSIFQFAKLKNLLKKTAYKPMALYTGNRVQDCLHSTNGYQDIGNQRFQ